jgi:protein-disulfide isomerase
VLGAVVAIKFLPGNYLGLDRYVQARFDELGLGSADAVDQRIAVGIRRFVKQQREGSDAEQAASVPEPTPKDHVAGPRDARISLIEYSDFECPWCKKFHGTAQALLKAYPGQVNWVYRHYIVIPTHNPAARREAEAAECAAELGGNEAFWVFGNQVFANTRSNGGGVAGRTLEALASDAGLDPTAFRECLDSGRMAERVVEDVRQGRELGLRGTPANFLRDNATGRMVPLTGARPLEQFTRVVEEMLGSND